MRKIQLLLLTLICTSPLFSQKTQENQGNERISVVSKNKDTLWLINNDLGKLIANTWNYPNYISKNRPRIIMVDVLPTPTYVEMERKRNKKKFKG